MSASGAVAGTHARIHAAVRRIPRGRVTTYGAIARLAGVPGQARLVGYALSALRPGTTVPWHRVINARGRISLTDVAGARTAQAMRLHREGVRVGPDGSVSLTHYGWRVQTP